ncbi:hypothetical protein BDZ97DRAFT_1921686 [Flammula alnicola]|nr:hypothetical protein BDZ97DRAFT_1921686 [Flammula alnicola]
MPAYLQPLITQSEPVDIDAKNEAKDRRITWTTSLPLVLSHLDLATRSSGRRRRVRQKHKGGPNADPSRPTSSSYFQTEDPHRGEKGQTSGNIGKWESQAYTCPEEPPTKPEAWFLDVANPTWADLKAIGQVLHIHPLTLEDILQQDPREKLEIFSKLGYYFISFRAIESQATREKLQREAGLKDTPGYNKTLVNDDGSIGEANVYLTVFKDGICCFHFTDVSEHTDRVRNRMVLLEEVVNLSSDWIAHDIIDSIVDSFFPFVDDIEKEVTAIDHMIYLGEAGLLLPSGPRIDVALSKSPTRDSLMPSLKTEDTPGSQSTAVTQPSPEGEEEKTPEEKYTPAEKLRDSYRPRFVSPRLTIRLLFRRVRWYVGCAWRALWERSERPPSPRQLTVRRMARTRKLVTVLGRLLATKSDVVTQIRKRLTKAAAGAHGSEEFEVAIYMGDVHDHILMLQHSLDHYALMLSQSHPTYLSQLRMEFDKTKNVADRKLLLLTIITIACLCIGILTGLFSLNVNVPTNNHDPKTGKFNLFGIILTMDILIILTLLAVVRYWWKKAKRRRRPLF